jgi:hypothetical protein
VSTPTPARRRRKRAGVEAASGRAGSLRYWRGRDHPDTIEAERDAAALVMATYSRETVAKWGPLRTEDIERVVAILRGTPDGGAVG